MAEESKARKPSAAKRSTTKRTAPAEASVEPPTPPSEEEEFIRAALSLAPETVIEHVGMAQHEQAELDAMGQDKRREVVGQTYGPTMARQVTLYGVFLAIVAALAFGGKMLTDKLDEPPASNPDKAPWSQADAKQIPPKPIQ
jgi:hypothetical protein